MDPNLSELGLGSTELDYPRLHVPVQKQVHGVLQWKNKESYKSRHLKKRVGGNCREAVTAGWENLSYWPPVLSAESLSLWIGGS